jgi:hypothetical protein
MSFQAKFDPRLNNRQRAMMMQKQQQFEDVMNKFKETVEGIKGKSYSHNGGSIEMKGTINNQVNGVTSININLSEIKAEGIFKPVPKDILKAMIIQIGAVFNGILEQQMKEMYEASAPLRDMIPEMQKVAEIQNSEEEKQDEPEAEKSAA